MGPLAGSMMSAVRGLTPDQGAAAVSVPITGTEPSDLRSLLRVICPIGPVQRKQTGEMTATHPATDEVPQIQTAAFLPRLGRRVRDLPLVFALLAFVVGTFLVFAQPPGQGLDEAVHFNRVWELAQGHVVAPIHHGTPGGFIPRCVSDYLAHFSAHASEPGPFSFNQYWHSPNPCSQASPFTTVGTAAANSPISYAPSLIVVAIFRGAGAPLPVIFFAGRLGSLLGFIALFYLAMRITPVGKQVFFVLGLLPTTLLLASSYSADPMTISLAALSVALTLRCSLRRQVDWPTALLLFLVLIGLCLTKPTLFIFAPLLLLVPTRTINHPRHPWLVRIGALVVVLGCAGLWYLAVRHVAQAPVPLYGLNSHTQTRFILDHPIGYLKVLARTFFVGTGEGRWIPGFFFSIGYIRTDSVYAPIGLVIVGSLTLFYAYQLQFGARRIVDHATRLLAWLPVALAAVGVLIVETTLFIYGTPVGLPFTQAQGRYFIPLLLLVLVTIGLLREPRKEERATRWVCLGVVLMLMWLVLKIFVHDYSL